MPKSNTKPISKQSVAQQTPLSQLGLASASVPYKPPPSPTHQLLTNCKSKSTVTGGVELQPYPKSPSPTRQLATIHKRVVSPTGDGATNARVMTVEVGVTSTKDSTTRPTKIHHHRDKNSTSASGSNGGHVERRSTHIGTGKQSIRSSKRFVKYSTFLTINTKEQFTIQHFKSESNQSFLEENFLKTNKH